MAIPLAYNLRSTFRRRGATLLTLTAISFSVAVLVLVLALARGFELSLTSTGAEENAILLRDGATSEGVSGVEREEARIVGAAPFVARDEDGRPLSQPEIYAAFAVETLRGGKVNIPVRGTGPTGFAIRDRVAMEQGRMFVPGRYEIVVGRSVAPKLAGCYVGNTITLCGYDWYVSGILDSEGQAYDSEIWLDVEIFMRVLNRGGYSTLLMEMVDAGIYPEANERLEGDPRLSVQLKSEPQYFAEQAGALGLALKVLAWFLAVVMGTGAVFGAANTMLASVSMRTKEIGTLLAIGFTPRSIFFGFLLESVAIALVGGGLGVLLGAQCNGLATGTANWTTFTEQSFAFQVTSDVVVQAMVLALLIGVVGGALPARRASRLVPQEALRTM